MKNLLISKSFSYEIVDSTLLRQTNTYHLGGGRSIQLSYGNMYKIVCDLLLHILQKVSVVGFLRRRVLYPAELRGLERYEVYEKSFFTSQDFDDLDIRRRSLYPSELRKRV